MTSIGLYWRTLRHLRFTQIAYQLYYRLVPARPARRLVGLQLRRGLPALDFAAPVVPTGLDAGTIAHVGLVAADGRPVVIPMLYARDGDRVLIHGAPAARLLRAGKGGTDLCLTVTLLDGLVLARSAFHHSLNFRSVVLFGRATPVADLTERARALDRFTDHLLPGRLPTLRPMTDNEVRGTLVLAVPIAEASAKIRTGDPVDEPADLDHPVWAGVLPVRLTPGVPVPSADLRPGIDVPPDVSGWTR